VVRPQQLLTILKMPRISRTSNGFVTASAGIQRVSNTEGHTTWSARFCPSAVVKSVCTGFGTSTGISLLLWLRFKISSLLHFRVIFNTWINRSIDTGILTGIILVFCKIYLCSFWFHTSSSTRKQMTSSGISLLIT